MERLFSFFYLNLFYLHHLSSILIYFVVVEFLFHYHLQSVNLFVFVYLMQALELLNQSNFEKIEISKIMNYGIFFSFFSIKLALKINDFFENLFNNNLGFLFLVQLKK